MSENILYTYVSIYISKFFCKLWAIKAFLNSQTMSQILKEQASTRKNTYITSRKSWGIKIWMSIMIFNYSYFSFHFSHSQKFIKIAHFLTVSMYDILRVTTVVKTRADFTFDITYKIFSWKAILFIGDISELWIGYNGEIIEEKYILHSQEFLDCTCTYTSIKDY